MLSLNLSVSRTWPSRPLHLSSADRIMGADSLHWLSSKTLMALVRLLELHTCARSRYSMPDRQVKHTADNTLKGSARWHCAFRKAFLTSDGPSLLSPSAACMHAAMHLQVLTHAPGRTS
jgi:hypothetical protein